MNRFARGLAIAAGLALPATAALATPATRADQAYCTALSETYVRYIGHDEDYGHHRGYLRGALDAQVAVAECRQGNAAAAIPVLERELTKQKFTLPLRD